MTPPVIAYGEFWHVALELISTQINLAHRVSYPVTRNIHGWTNTLKTIAIKLERRR